MSAQDKVLSDQLRANLVATEVPTVGTSATITVAQGRRRRIATLTSDITLTIAATDAAPGDTITTVRDDASFYHVRFVDQVSGLQIANLPGPDTFVAEWNGANWKSQLVVPQGPRRPDARSYGARGNASMRDDTALQLLIDAVPVDGGVCYLPPGDYRLEASLNVMDGGSNPRRNLRIFGDVNGSTGLINTRFTWQGADGGVMLKMFTSNSEVQGIAFRAGSGKHPLAMVSIDKSVLSGAGIGTHNMIRRCQFIGNLDGGQCDHAILIGATPGVNNLEFNRFHECMFWGVTTSLVKIASTTAQSKSNTFDKCYFLYSPIGIHQISGSFHARDCSFTGLNDRAIWIEEMAEPILIENSNEEQCNCFLYAAGASHSSIEISRGRFDLQQMDLGLVDYNGQFIFYSSRGSLILRGNLFAVGAAQGGEFRVLCGSADPIGTLVSEGNMYPNATPFTSGGGYHKLYSLGDIGYTGSAYMKLPDVLGAYSSTAFSGGVGLGSTVLGGALNLPIFLIGYSAHITVNVARASVQEITTLTGNIEIDAFTNLVDGPFALWLKQDADGGRTMTWPAAQVRFTGTDAVLSTAGNAVDLYEGMVKNGIIYFNAVKKGFT